MSLRARQEEIFSPPMKSVHSFHVFVSSLLAGFLYFCITDPTSPSFRAAISSSVICITDFYTMYLLLIPVYIQ
jgi:hypothetical protein